MTQPNSTNAKDSLHADRLTKDVLTELSADPYEQPRLFQKNPQINLSQQALQHPM